jgi:DNA-binding transcriptional ArsR family regulator
MAIRESQLDRAFFALSDPARRRILQQLTQGPATVGDVGRPLEMAAPSVTKHVKVLEEAGLVSREVRGREHWLTIEAGGFRTVVQHLQDYERFWEMSLDRLHRLLDADEPT